MFPIAATEAVNGFKKGHHYLERFFTSPHHIEIQLMGDRKGNMLWLGKRDCSVQRQDEPSP